MSTLEFARPDSLAQALACKAQPVGEGGSLWLAVAVQALCVAYVLHLLVLAAFQVSGLLPTTGTWGLALVAGIVLLATQVLKVVSLMPFRVGRRTPR